MWEVVTRNDEAGKEKGQRRGEKWKKSGKRGNTAPYRLKSRVRHYYKLYRDHVLRLLNLSKTKESAAVDWRAFLGRCLFKSVDVRRFYVRARH